MLFTDKPDIIFNGGDSIFDALNHDKDAVKEEWKSWHSTLKSENAHIMIACIGNHDVASPVYESVKNNTG